MDAALSYRTSTVAGDRTATPGGSMRVPRPSIPSRLRVACRAMRATYAARFVMALVAGAPACAGGGGPPVVEATATSRGTMHVLTEEELRRHSSATTSLYELVRELRIGFVQHRDGEE